MEELLINQSGVYKRNEMKHFVVHICFLSLCNKAVSNEFFHKTKLCMSIKVNCLLQAYLNRNYSAHCVVSHLRRQFATRY